MRLADKDSFGFVFCGWRQQLALADLFEQQPYVKVTPCVVERKPFPNQIRRESTAYPINSVEYGLHIKVGDPKWANYGIIRLIIGIDRKTGRPNAYLKNIFKPNWPPQHEKHPFNKPVGLYVQMLKAFSRPEHNILEAFAGTCTSVEACLELGRNLVLVEKDPNQKKLFQERIAVTQVKLAQMGGEDDTEQAQPQPLDSTVQGSSTGTAGNPKRRLTPPEPLSNPKRVRMRPNDPQGELAQELAEDAEDVEEQEEEEGEQDDEEQEEEEREQDDEEEEEEEERDSDIDSYTSNPKSDDSSDHDFVPNHDYVPKSPVFPADSPTRGTTEYPAETQDSKAPNPLLESTSVLKPLPQKTKVNPKESSNKSKKGFVTLKGLAKQKSKQPKE